MKKFLPAFLLCLFLNGAPLLRSEAAALTPPPSSPWVKVNKVVDGDTLTLKGGTKIRLIGIDTPEVHESEKLDHDAERTHRDRKTIQKLGKKASAITEKLLKGEDVRLEFGDERLDRHGRTLAYVFFRMAPDKFEKIFGRGERATGPAPEREYMLNRVLVEQGYAVAYTRFPFEYSREFIDLERKAREMRRGLWADESNPLEPEPAPARPRNPRPPS